MEKRCSHTDLVCLVCRAVFAECKGQFIFPIVFDFCPDCEGLMNYDFARQMQGMPAMPLKALREPLKRHRKQLAAREDDGA
ncbi:MAG TPA: hypothetical protein VFX17_02065 [Patescibacteria group bacterium]|nr:hypothetical protein [Patescibacteria group bacterium]